MTDSFSHKEPPGAALSWEVLDRYLAGEYTPSEASIIGELIAQYPNGQVLVRELREGLRVQGNQRFETSASLAELLSKIGAVDSARSVSGAPEKEWRGKVGARASGGSALRIRTLRQLGWPIAIALAIIITIVFVRTDRPSGRETTASYTTHAGQQAVLTLVDGTRVTLSPRSTLRLMQFGEQSRTLVLDGEAYFEVSQSSRLPFIVRTKSVSARVLGTNFMVRHYAGDRSVRVAVADGKVLVTSQASRWKDVALVKGAIGDFGDSTVQVGTVNDVAPGAEWRDGKLVFHHTSVATILQALGRWYGYHFQCSDAALPRQDVTIALSMQSSSAALAALEEILNVNLNIAGDTITLTPHPPQRSKVMPRTQSYDVWTPTKEAGR